jgi:hypothetical protein
VSGHEHNNVNRELKADYYLLINARKLKERGQTQEIK